MYSYSCYFFFNDTATTEIYTLSLHDALPISILPQREHVDRAPFAVVREGHLDDRIPPESLVEPDGRIGEDRKSTRLNSSHANISYAVFCLKKKTDSYSADTVSSVSRTSAACH